MKKLFLLLLFLPSFVFSQQEKIFLIQDLDEDVDCYFFRELCDNSQEGIGVAFYNTGEKMASLSCDRQRGGWTLIYYYKNGNKKYEEIYYGCDTESGPNKSWYENGALKEYNYWEGYSKWYDNGNLKEVYESKSDDTGWGSCVYKHITYYETGQMKTFFVCEDCDTEDVWDNCIPEKCYNNIGERIKCLK